MRAIDKAIKHRQHLGLRCIPVPEWELEVYHHQLTLADFDKLDAWTKERSRRETAAYALILFATDKDGQPLFGKEDKQALLTEVDGAVLDRVASKILYAPSVADQVND